MKKATALTLAALNALTFTTGLFAKSSPALTQAESKPELASLNQTSLKAIESGWIALPITCKARGFNAEPVTSVIMARHEALAVFAAFESASV